jgi:hypothetical protein
MGDIFIFQVITGEESMTEKLISIDQLKLNKSLPFREIPKHCLELDA